MPKTTLRDTGYYREPGGGYRDDIPKGTIVDIVGSALNGQWSQISGQDPNPWKGKWVLSAHLGEVNVEPPPDPDVFITHVIEVYSDGSIRVDGLPYP